MDADAYRLLKNGTRDIKKNNNNNRQQRKKPTTLTARATARYAHDDDSSIFATERETHTVDDLESTVDFGLGRKTKSHKEKGGDCIIISPEAATKSLQEQELLFGTCSQLEREDSPTALREIQKAIGDSESYAYTDHQSDNPSRNAQLNQSYSSVSRFTGGRDLWRVAARDFDGSTAQIEVVDLAEHDDISEELSAPDRHHRTTPPEHSGSGIETNDLLEETQAPERAVGEESQDSQKDTVEPDTINRENPSQNSKPNGISSMPQYEGFTDFELAKEIKDYGFKTVKGRKKKIELLQKCWESRCEKQAEPADTMPKRKRGRPNVRSETSSTGQKEKGQKKTSDNATAQANEQHGPVPIPSQPEMTSKNTRTNPTKTSEARRRGIGKSSSYKAIEEIEDSEDEGLLSPFHLRGHYNIGPERNSPLPILEIPSSSPSHSRSQQTKSRAYSPFSAASPSRSSAGRGSKVPDLDAQITTAVHAQPRFPFLASKRPTWHEKMLMYDPIVLEDFTSWLNMEGLGRIAEDREVNALFVRGWCEKRGVCSCWRKGSVDK